VPYCILFGVLCLCSREHRPSSQLNDWNSKPNLKNYFKALKDIEFGIVFYYQIQLFDNLFQLHINECHYSLIYFRLIPNPFTESLLFRVLLSIDSCYLYTNLCLHLVHAKITPQHRTSSVRWDNFVFQAVKLTSVVRISSFCCERYFSSPGIHPDLRTWKKAGVF